MCHGVPWRIFIFCAAVYIRPTPWPTTSLVLLFVNCTIPPHCSTIPTIWTKNIESRVRHSTVLVYLSTIDTVSHDTSCWFNCALTYLPVIWYTTKVNKNDTGISVKLTLLWVTTFHTLQKVMQKPKSAESVPQIHLKHPLTGLTWSDTLGQCPLHVVFLYRVDTSALWQRHRGRTVGARSSSTPVR